MKRFLNLLLGARRNGLLNEHGHTREMFQNLQLDIAAWLDTTTEHGRTADDDHIRAFLVRHRFNEFLEGLEDACVLVGGHDERLAFFLQDGFGALCGGIDERDDFEARTEFAERRKMSEIRGRERMRDVLFETEGMVPRTLVGA